MAATFSYSGNPGSSAKDLVRLLIGDTDASEPLMLDTEIEYFLGQYNQVALNAGIRCCEIIMTKFSRMADETVGQVKISFNQRYKAYQEMKAELQRRVAIEGAVPYCGGISKLDTQQVRNNADRVRPDFTKHMMENELISPWTTDPFGIQGDQQLVDGEGG